ncbi:hypothetical protein B0H11DRAFT_2077020 [Mycena galericulata]|nr:hypothetical protein B0H11DRAFT_2077020 [Mycena galericulata]
MADDIEEVYDILHPLLTDLPAPSQNDTPRTRNAWQELYALLHGVSATISDQHPDFAAIFADEDARGADEDEDPDATRINLDQQTRDNEEDPQSDPAEAKKRRGAQAAKLQVTKRAQKILGEASKSRIRPHELAELIAVPVVTTAEKDEDAALGRVLRGYKDGDWSEVMESFTGEAAETDVWFCEISRELDDEPDLIKRDINLRQTQSARHTEHYLSNLLLNIDTIKFAKEWNLRTGPGSGKFKAKFNETLFQRENDAIFRDLSSDEVRDKMEDYAGEFELFKQSRQSIVTARNRLSFAFDNLGTGILIDPFFSVHNLGDRRAKKFQSLLDMLIRLAPDSQHPETGNRTRLEDLEQSNRSVLYSLSASLCANEDEREMIAQYIDEFYIKYPSRVRL